MPGCAWGDGGWVGSMRVVDGGGWPKGVRSMGERGRGKGERRERERREIERRKDEREEKKMFWLVQVFEIRIYTVFDFLEKIYFFACSKS